MEMIVQMIEAAAGDGYFKTDADAEGTVRRPSPASLSGSDFFAPEALVTVDHYLKRPPLAAQAAAVLLLEGDPLLISDKRSPGFGKAGHTCPLFG